MQASTSSTETAPGDAGVPVPPPSPIRCHRGVRQRASTGTGGVPGPVPPQAAEKLHSSSRGSRTGLPAVAKPPGSALRPGEAQG